MSHTKCRWVRHLLTYVKSCGRGRVKDFEQRSCVYNAGFFMDPEDRVVMELQCSKLVDFQVLVTYLSIFQ